MTHAEVSRLHELTGSSPVVRFPDGIERFAAWYRTWAGV